jgi:orotidine-5'-phosphate decarboxylase
VESAADDTRRSDLPNAAQTVEKAASANFGERFDAAARRTDHAICVGLDPRVDEMPPYIREQALAKSQTPADAAGQAIVHFHRVVVEAIAGLVPAVKLQLAFYEQYGLAGLAAFCETVRAAREARLIVIGDGKRNDIASTAEAYARAYLGQPTAFGEPIDAFGVDAMTVNPYLGEDSILPFVEAAHRYGTGVFLLLHTSNPSAVELQDLEADGQPSYLRVAALAERLQNAYFANGQFGSIGAIVGCTYPEAAAVIRHAMPRSPIVVVGYGAQGGSVAGCKACFTPTGTGALVNASRSLTYRLKTEVNSDRGLASAIRRNIKSMDEDLQR